ncbi:glucose 1-dehydrogenase [Weissella uvarum]|uniref:glucose 1-dehydrogenase n=1 Tax=Weissella uvarum TaxID=1479233 RepID=UPI00195FE614|nr:glucose 1-dehydrogenase [Weissella uvarum]MBM7616985.1 glucose 1-dehydrogenase [Weissella uvarum]MCM0595285.1 glucose 1-dehydrogenase [Weissella uvarum]
MYTDLQGKTAVVTGGTTGLGMSIVERYLEEGMNVVADYVGELKMTDDLKALQDKYGKKLVLAQADVSNEDDVDSLAKAATDNFGSIDVWVNNAGIEKPFATADMPYDEWQKVIDVNLGGVFLGTRAALRDFQKNSTKGSIINMSSVHQQIPWPTFAHYAASKGGTKMFTETVALEYAEQGIRVNDICPGAIDTPINAKKFADPKQKAKTESMVPMKEIGKPSYVADAAAFLASEQAHYVTGTSLFVDGGMALYPAFEGGAG